jgi:aerobic carbon-monoxide dehydrogenase medium subunit
VEFTRATSEEHAVAWLATRGDATCVLAGGTDVMMQYARGELTPDCFLHIGGIEPLAAAAPGKANGASSRFGTLVTHRFLARDPLVRRRHPALAEAAATVGGWQTQAVGTLGGNLCNASPAADTAPPLLAADAVVELTSASGTRRLPLRDFFTGRRTVDRRPDELLTAIEAVPAGQGAGEVYLKVGRRGAMVVAVAGLAMRLTFDGQHRVRDARLALCSVAPTPARAPETERILMQGGATAEAVREAAVALQREIAPIDDARATAAYRRLILRGLLERAVACCRARAEGMAVST